MGLDRGERPAVARRTAWARALGSLSCPFPVPSAQCGARCPGERRRRGGGEGWQGGRARLPQEVRHHRHLRPEGEVRGRQGSPRGACRTPPAPPRPWGPIAGTGVGAGRGSGSSHLSPRPQAPRLALRKVLDWVTAQERGCRPGTEDRCGAGRAQTPPLRCAAAGACLGLTRMSTC